jgi:hypothetical protein
MYNPIGSNFDPGFDYTNPKQGREASIEFDFDQIEAKWDIIEKYCVMKCDLAKNRVNKSKK